MSNPKNAKLRKEESIARMGERKGKGRNRKEQVAGLKQTSSVGNKNIRARRFWDRGKGRVTPSESGREKTVERPFGFPSRRK